MPNMTRKPRHCGERKKEIELGIESNQEGGGGSAEGVMPDGETKEGTSS